MKKLSEMLNHAIHLNKTKMFGEGSRHEQPMYDNFNEMLVEHHHVFAQFMKNVDGELFVTNELFAALMTAYSFGALSALTILQNGMVVRNESGSVVDRAYYALPELIAEVDSLLAPSAAVTSLKIAMTEMLVEHNTDAEDELDEQQEQEEQQEGEIEARQHEEEMQMYH